MTTAEPRTISVVETAHIVRQVLRDRFPLIRFSVRISRFSMGSSIHVSFTGSLDLRHQVTEAVAQFCGTEPSPCGDYRDAVTRTWNGEPVRFGNDYISVHSNPPALAVDTPLDVTYCEHGVPDYLPCPRCGGRS